MRQFIAYSSRSLDRSFEMHPPESRAVSSCADASTKNIIDCGFFRHLDSLPRQSTGASQLLPSASFSAPARIEPAQPFRIYRHTLSISLNYFVAGSTDH
jgi:hypothetical protein